MIYIFMAVLWVCLGEMVRIVMLLVADSSNPKIMKMCGDMTVSEVKSVGRFAFILLGPFLVILAATLPSRLFK